MAKKFSFDKNLKITVNTFKDVLKDFNDHFKNKQKSTEEYEVMSFWCVTIHIFWKFIQYTIHWDKTQMLKTFPFNKINGVKIALFSLANSN